MFETSIDRNQIILASNLDAVSGIIKDSLLGVFGRPSECRENPTQFIIVDVNKRKHTSFRASKHRNTLLVRDTRKANSC